MSSLFSLQCAREVGHLRDTTYWKAIRDSDYLVKRLKNTTILGGHSGCVNTVSWNGTGTQLLSGGDDCHLNIYDTATGLLRHSVHSTHRSNIFSAKFLPCADGCKAVSCAGIGSLEYTELTPMGDYIGHVFKCQTSITYQVATTPLVSNEFLTCEEKGCVRLFDIRVKTSCMCNGCNKDVLYKFSTSATSMAIHPLSPHYIIFGLGDGTVQLLDRRMIGTLTIPNAVDLPGITTYKPSHLRDKTYKITSVQFNGSGSEVLASYSEDYLYLFNSGLFGGGAKEIMKPTYLSQCESYPGKRKRGETVRMKPIVSTKSSKTANESPLSPPSTSEESPPMKRLRLRGDWSDTGPEARPEAQSTLEGPNLMNRMSRMFSQWVDMSLGSSSERRGGHGRRRGSPSVQTSSSSENSFHLFSDDSPPHSSTDTLPSASCDTRSPQDSAAPGPSSHMPALSPGGLPVEESAPSMEHGSDKELRKRLLEPVEERGDGFSDNSKLGDSSGSSRLLPGVQSCEEGQNQATIFRQNSGTGASVIVESRGTNSCIPAIQIVEGETDSDDLGSCDKQNKSCDCTQGSKFKGERSEEDSDECGMEEVSEDEGLIRPFMMYKGHRNARTMIKQANFWGENWVMSGSDCGRVFVWDKWTGEIVNLLMADSHVVNCVQPHPDAYVIATSGIDYNIKLWEPKSEELCSLDNLEEIISRNELMLQESKNTVTVPSTFVLRILAYLNRRRRLQTDQHHSEESDSD